MVIAVRRFDFYIGVAKESIAVLAVTRSWDLLEALSGVLQNSCWMADVVARCRAVREGVVL
jgi:hypothetical protein